MPPGDLDLIGWARAEALTLRVRAQDEDVTQGMGRAVEARPKAAAALEFLRVNAPDTSFYTAAYWELSESGSASAKNALRRVAELLEDWANYVEAGLAGALPFPARARLTASTDLMEQVQQLLDDNQMHPAASIVLAGAALEEFLRARVVAQGATVNGKPGIAAYASALRTIGELSTQDIKDITAWAGQRNEAAHGQFDKLSRERAQIMVDGINLFMRQKADAQDA